MKVSNSQFWGISALTVCAILWLLLLTCYREYWGFWQSPENYRFLSREYPQWFRDYIQDYYSSTLLFTGCLYIGWLLIASKRVAWSRGARLSILLVTLLMGLTLGVMSSNNMIHFLDSGHLHGKTHLQIRD